MEIPAIAEMIEGTLDRMRKCSEQHNLNIDANTVAPTFRSARADLKVSATKRILLGQHYWTGLPSPQPHLPLVYAAHED